MSVRPPSSLNRSQTDNPFEAALEAEFRSEAAATHGRLLAKLKKALDAYREIEGSDDELARQKLDEAGEALWYIVIQRELMGIRNLDGLLAELDVPPVIRFKAGV